MSVNLYARIRVGKHQEDIPLWQTPTHITHMILVDADGRMGEKRGRDALKALRAYCEWVKGEAQAAFNRARGNYDTSSHTDHIKMVMGYVKKASPDLVVGMI